MAPINGIHLVKWKGAQATQVIPMVTATAQMKQNKGAAAAAERKSKYATLVDAYYNVVTLFYEWGWGSSFHFAYLLRGENFLASIRRHEYYLVSRLNVGPGSKLLDVGCGIGGPLMNIARFGRWDVTGITINHHQIQRGTQLIAQAGLSKTARVVQGDFNALPFEADSFDGVYAIEATCHAPKREGVYGQAFKVLKSGGRFALYEWVMTDKYIPGNPEHERIKHLVEEGDALPSLTNAEECINALKNVGFVIEEVRDMALDDGQHLPWYWPLEPTWNPLLFRFQFNWFGLKMTKAILRVMEALHVAPKGSSKVQAMLQKGAEGLYAVGTAGIMTPMLLLVARKP